jgi:hypothetical protein
MINRVFRLKKATKLPNGVVFNGGQEIEIVLDVVYVNGFPIPFEMQATMIKWIKENPMLFDDVTKNW